MNRSNNGYQLTNLELPQNQTSPLPGANLAAVADSMAAGAAGLERMARQQQQTVNRLAEQRGRADGAQAGQTALGPLPGRAGTAYGDAVRSSARDALAADLEMRLRARLGEVDAATADDDDTGFYDQARTAMDEVLEPLVSVEKSDPDPVWSELRAGLSRVAMGMVNSGTNARAGRRRAVTERAETETLASRETQRQADFLARARDLAVARRAQAVAAPAAPAVAPAAGTEPTAPAGDPAAAPAPDAAAAPAAPVANEPLPEEAAFAAAEQAWIDSLVVLGPREAFTLNGVTYGADPSRRAALSEGALQERARRVQVAQTATREQVGLEAAGDAQAQIAYAEDFARRWRAREGVPEGVSDAELETIETDLKQRAAVSLGAERTQDAVAEGQVRELITFVQAGGRLSEEQQAEGDRLTSVLEDEGLGQIWDNAKTMSRTGARMVADSFLRSVRGNAAPRAPLTWGTRSATRGQYRFSTGGGRRRRSGGGGAVSIDTSADGSAFAAFANTQPGAASDPLQWAHRQGMPVPSLNLRNLVTGSREAGRAAGTQLIARRAYSAQLSDQAGVPGRIFTNAERRWFQNLVERDPNQAMIAAGVIRTALGDDGPRAFAELGVERGAGMVAGLVAGGTNPAFAQSIVRGSTVRAELPRPQRTVVDSITNTLRSEWNHAPYLAGQMDDAREAALAVMRDRVENGQPPGDAASIMQSIMGSTRRNGVDYGGFTYVNGKPTLVPGWLRRDRMDDFLHLAAQGIPSNARFPDGRAPSQRQVRGMQLLPIGENQFVVATGRMQGGRPQVLVGATGQPYVLDADQMRPFIQRTNPSWIAGR
jgi:hypothetical protein